MRLIISVNLRLTEFGCFREASTCFWPAGPAPFWRDAHGKPRWRNIGNITALHDRVVNDLERPRAMLSGYKYGAGWATVRTTNSTERYVRLPLERDWRHIEIPSGIARSSTLCIESDSVTLLSTFESVTNHCQKSKCVHLNSFIIARNYVVINYCRLLLRVSSSEQGRHSIYRGLM